jgi:hypothetical protein
MDGTFQFGSNQPHGVRENDIISLLKDYIDVALFKDIKKEDYNSSKDKEITSNTELWNFLINNEGYPNQKIKIKNFFILEWIPTSPGQYFTFEAMDMRRQADRRSREYINPFQKFIELRPNEKESMIKGGLGSLRLGPKKIEGETKHILGLSSSAISHQGIPLLINQTLYVKIVNEIKEKGLTCVNLTGSLRLIPSDNFGIKVRYNKNVPKYCIEAEEIETIKFSPISPQVSIAILYNKHESDWGSNYGHSFCTFEPIQRDNQLKLAIEWLNDYAVRYSGDVEPNIIGDFDEYYEHFTSVDLPIIQIANGHIPYDKLKELKNKGNFHFEIVQGDKIQSGNNSPIISRSNINSPKEISTMKDKILFLTSNPSNTSRLRIDKEAREIEEGLRRSNKRDSFDFEIRLATRPRDLSRAILDENPQILHFSGHGETEGILLEDENGASKIVTTSAISSLFSLFGDTIKCVLLNSCYSKSQAQEISKHIPFVIGMSKAVPDATAIAFATSFYDAIGAGRDIEFAFKFGVSNISLEGLNGNEIPVLLKKTN